MILYRNGDIIEIKQQKNIVERNIKKIIRATTIPRSLNAFCNGMLKELSEKYEVVAVSSPEKELKEVAEREGVRTIGVPMERKISLLKDIRSLLQMVKVFKKEKPTMVHSMTPKAGLICMMAAKLCGVPVRVHTFTGLVWPTETGLKRRILKATDWLTCACATHVIPEGHGVLDDLKNGGITKKPMTVLGYGNVKGVDMNYFRRSEDVMRRAVELRDENKFTFLYVGRIVRDKGINELIQAFCRLLSARPKVRLIMVGPYENDHDPVSPETHKAINITEGIEAVGPKFGEELLPYYVASDSFVFPSYREGFPNTVMEAGAMELPSIVTDINGSREIIENGINGIIIPSKNVDALYDAMLKMVDNEDMRHTMANVSRKMIGERFEKGFVRKCLYDYYDDILKDC